MATLLLERFWVLERSIDVNGADFLIQRRLTSATVLDASPPRFGVVQAKYFQGDSTELRIPRHYVADAEGRPYREFFLIATTGSEDSQQYYLLDGPQIVERFDVRERGQTETLVVSARRLTSSSEHRVDSKRLALDRMEHALAIADLSRNRRLFVSGLNWSSIDPSQIEYEFTLPLHNTYGDIPGTFFEMKKAAQDILLDMWEVADGLQDLSVSLDPIEAHRIYQDKVAPHVNMYRRLSFEVGRVTDEDLLFVSERHRRRHKALAESGVESAYLEVQATLVQEISSALGQHHDPERGSRVSVDVEFSRRGLTPVSVGAQVEPLDDGPTPARHIDPILQDGSGHFVFTIPSRRDFEGWGWRSANYSTWMEERVAFQVGSLMVLVEKELLGLDVDD